MLPIDVVINERELNLKNPSDISGNDPLHCDTTYRLTGQIRILYGRHCYLIAFTHHRSTPRSKQATKQTGHLRTDLRHRVGCLKRYARLMCAYQDAPLLVRVPRPHTLENLHFQDKDGRMVASF